MFVDYELCVLSARAFLAVVFCGLSVLDRKSYKLFRQREEFFFLRFPARWTHFFLVSCELCAEMKKKKMPTTT